MRGDSLPDDCGRHPRCPWDCPGCPKNIDPPPVTGGYFPCPRCKVVCAYWDINGTIYCAVDKERFHADFERMVARLDDAPDPPAEDT